jgi:recombinational DNA repair protein (RecF pathway)
MNKRCHRCGKQTDVTTMSFFNTDILCMECVDKERAHPAFEAAHEAEREAVRRGDYNFPGVGKPRDL